MQQCVGVQVPMPAPASSRTSYRSRRRFFVPNKRHRSFTPSLLLSKLNPLTLGFNLGFFFLQSPFGFVSGNSRRLLPVAALTTLRLLPNPKHLASDLFFSLLLQSPLSFVSGNSQRLLPKTAFAPLRLLPNPKPTGFGFVFFASSAKSVQLRFRQQPETIAGSCAHYLAPPSKSEALGFGVIFSLLFTDLSEDKQSIVSLLTAVLGAALVKKHDFLATTQRARVVDIILQAEHSSRMVETRKYSKA